MTQDNLILLAAGGTGGHLFPAQALAHALSERGARVQLATDERALQYGDAFPAEKIHEIASATPTGGSLASKAAAALRLGRGVLAGLCVAGTDKASRCRVFWRLSHRAASAGRRLARRAADPA